MLADLAGAYILDNTKSHFRKSKCYGLYRDDGISAFNNKRFYDDMLKWRTKFQNSVNRLAEGTETTCNSPAACGWTSQEESCQKNRMTPRHLLKQGTSFHA